MYARANFWSVFNPAGKTDYERKIIKRFDNLEDAQDWIMDGRRFGHGYIIRFVPYYKEEEFDNWRPEYTNPIIKEIFKNFKKSA